MNKQVAQLFSSIDQHRLQARPPESPNCECLTNQTELSRSYYSTQKQLIEQTLIRMNNADEKDSDIIARLLSEMVAYITTIL